MARLFIALAVTLTVACGASPSTEERTPGTGTPTGALSPVLSDPENPVDRVIRSALNRAIAQDADLRNRDITFRVINGDVTVAGTVVTERERRKVGDIAMNVDGVKSVANNVLIAE